MVKVIQVKKDPIFLNLCWLNYLHNYKPNRSSIAKVLTENHALYSILLIKDLPNAERYCTKKLEWRDFDFDALKPYFINKSDGAYLVQGNKISNKQILDRVVDDAMKKSRLKTEALISKFLSKDYFCVGSQCAGEIGSRSMFAIAAALLGDDATAVYKLGQTVYGASTGKLSKITRDGLAIDAYFERYAVTKFKIPNEFNFYTYKQAAKISMFYDVLVVKFYHYSDKAHKVQLMGEFLVKPKELEDYYESKSTALKFYKKFEAVRDRSGARKLTTMLDIVGLE